jgi:threonine dehydrogenase-like Zn-dependent dehydrogenase
MDAGRIFAVDHVESRLDMARGQSAETIHFEKEHPVATIREVTDGIGADRAIDAVASTRNAPIQARLPRKRMRK